MKGMLLQLLCEVLSWPWGKHMFGQHPTFQSQFEHAKFSCWDFDGNLVNGVFQNVKLLWVMITNLYLLVTKSFCRWWLKRDPFPPNGQVNGRNGRNCIPASRWKPYSIDPTQFWRNKAKGQANPKWNLEAPLPPRDSSVRVSSFHPGCTLVMWFSQPWPHRIQTQAWKEQSSTFLRKTHMYIHKQNLQSYYWNWQTLSGTLFYSVKLDMLVEILF